jgi:hypothetical protein
VRVETGSGGATCFWAPTAAVAQIERAFYASDEAARGMQRNLTADKFNLACGSRGELAAMTDEIYVSLLVWIICALLFSCGVVAIGQHPGWFSG